jgi:hypothetical protein
VLPALADAVETVCATLAPLPQLCRSTLFELLRETMRALRLVLLRGGPKRRYKPADHALFARDLEALAQLFGEQQPAAAAAAAADGCGRLTRAQTELLVRPLHNVVVATAMDSDVLIAKLDATRPGALPPDHPCSRAHLWQTLEMRADAQARAYVADGSRRPGPDEEGGAPAAVEAPTPATSPAGAARRPD